MTISAKALWLAESPDWLAIYKPIGVGMHTEGDELGIVVLASQLFGYELWPVHRLDKVTSGILLLAKHQTAAARLSLLFREQRIQKWYLAQSALRPSKKQGWVKGDMEKGRNGSWLLKRSQENPAITQFFSHYDEALKKRLFLLRPHTGRTHQLRVALKSLGSAIDGDSRYKGQACDRTYLHAYALQFEDPCSQTGHIVQLFCLPREGLWSMLPNDWQSPWRLL